MVYFITFCTEDTLRTAKARATMPPKAIAANTSIV